MPAQSAGAIPNHEAHLLKFIEDVGGRCEGRHAVHIHLSRLRPHNRRDFHLRVAAAILADLVGRFDGRIFRLSNADMVFVHRESERAPIDKVVDKLRDLFSEDPLTHRGQEDTADPFCTRYDLAAEYADFRRVARKLHDDARAAEESAATANRPAKLKPLDPQSLGLVERAIAHADVSSLLRRQPVCAIVPGRPAPEPVFTELYVSIADLQQAVAPKIDLTADRWLFQYLTETLDRRVLAYLAKVRSSALSQRISINVNVRTLLSPEFMAFDSCLSPAQRGTVAVELQSFDIVADMSAFRFICEFMRDRGYRLCFDGLTHLTLPYVDRQALGVDLLKIYWDPDMADYLQGRRHEAVRKLVARAGEGRVILCRCDSPAAVAVGQSVGISLFQGRSVDAALAGRAAHAAE